MGIDCIEIYLGIIYKVGHPNLSRVSSFGTLEQRYSNQPSYMASDCDLLLGFFSSGTSVMLNIEFSIKIITD